jgi:hypothetical protein
MAAMRLSRLSFSLLSVLLLSSAFFAVGDGCEDCCLDSGDCDWAYNDAAPGTCCGTSSSTYYCCPSRSFCSSNWVNGAPSCVQNGTIIAAAYGFEPDTTWAGWVFAVIVFSVLVCLLAACISLYYGKRRNYEQPPVVYVPAALPASGYNNPPPPGVPVAYPGAPANQSYSGNPAMAQGPYVPAAPYTVEHTYQHPAFYGQPRTTGEGFQPVPAETSEGHRLS